MKLNIKPIHATRLFIFRKNIKIYERNFIPYTHTHTHTHTFVDHVMILY